MEENKQIDLSHNYGFRANLHQKSTEIPIRNKWLEKINPNNTTTPKRLVTLMFVVFICVVAYVITLSTNMTRMKYIFLPLTLILAGILGLLLLYSFVDRSNGSLLRIAFQLYKHQYHRYKLWQGKERKLREIGISNIRKEGLITFSNGDVGRLLSPDGSTSKTAFPTEILRQEVIATNYQRGRKRTAEIKFTDSQLQDATEQINNLSKLIDRTKDERVNEILKWQKFNVEKYINGRKNTIVQHLLLRDETEEALEESVERLIKFTNDGLYYDIQVLGREETYEYFFNIFNFY